MAFNTPRIKPIHQEWATHHWLKNLHLLFDTKIGKKLKAYPSSVLFYISFLYLNLIFISWESPINLVFHSIDSHCLVYKKTPLICSSQQQWCSLDPSIHMDRIFNEPGKNAALCDFQSAIQVVKDLWAHSDTFIVGYKGGHFSGYHISGICSFPCWLHHCHKEFQMGCWIGTFGF